jgi:hypothetical protein
MFIVSQSLKIFIHGAGVLKLARLTAPALFSSLFCSATLLFFYALMHLKGFYVPFSVLFKSSAY